MRRRARSIAALLLAVLVGCGGDPHRSTGEGQGGSATAGVGGGRAAGGDGGGGEGGRAPAGPPCTLGEVEGACVPAAACIAGGVAVPAACGDDGEVMCCVHGPVDCDPSLMVLPNNGLAEAPGDEGCLAGMARVASFCIDRFEASLLRADGSPWSPYFAPGDEPVRAVSLEAAVPQAYISGEHAAAACAGAGKRLCSDEEWLRACQGPEGMTYPYGDVLAPGLCNDARELHPVIEYFGTDEDWIWSELDNACIDQLPASLERTGSRRACATAEGAMDMMGNLHEWTADAEGTFRGGFYVDAAQNGPGCLYATTAHTTSYADYSTGFRCCADAR
jgi:hypothetical protein